MIHEGQRILVLGAHPDDESLGCGGLISRFSSKCEFVLAVATDRDGNIPIFRTSDLSSQTEEAAEILRGDNQGIVRVAHLNLPCFNLAANRQTVLECLERLRDEVKPHVVLTHAEHETHQDHACMRDESLRVFKGTTLLSYSILRSNYRLTPSVFVEISEEDLQKKISAVRCYSTQAGKRYCSAEVITAQAAVLGSMCGRRYAEGFAVEWVVQ